MKNRIRQTENPAQKADFPSLGKLDTKNPEVEPRDFLAGHLGGG